jgi:hypothetical protein
MSHLPPQSGGKAMAGKIGLPASPATASGADGAGSVFALEGRRGARAFTRTARLRLELERLM